MYHFSLQSRGNSLKPLFTSLSEDSLDTLEIDLKLTAKAMALAFGAYSSVISRTSFRDKLTILFQEAMSLGDFYRMICYILLNESIIANNYLNDSIFPKYLIVTKDDKEFLKIDVEVLLPRHMVLEDNEVSIIDFYEATTVLS